MGSEGLRDVWRAYGRRMVLRMTCATGGAAAPVGEKGPDSPADIWAKMKGAGR